jgi:transcriptional regulator with XRE-family HTH domain
MSTGRGDKPNAYARAVSAEVRRLMGERWFSGAKLAAKTGLSQNYLSKRLREELPFTLNDMTKIAEALEVDPTILLLSPLVSGIGGDAKRRSRSSKTKTN